MIDLHYWPTPNGKKVTILLEELGMPYRIVPCNIGRGDQFTDGFLKIGPNNRMPAMVDHEPVGGGPAISLFESGAIMMYLAEKAGRFYPQDLRGRYEVNQWLIWQMANQGPKTGEAGHFLPFYLKGKNARGDYFASPLYASWRKGAEVLGIDLSSKSLKVAQLHALEAQTPGVAYREVSAEALAAEQAGSFDVVTCLEMLEHVPDPASIVRACATLVKPGGWVFFSTLNRNPKSFLFAIVGAEYVLGLLPRGTHEYARMIRPSELAADCRRAGLDLQATRGMEYNPLTRRYWLSGDTSVNYLLATRRGA